MIEAVGSFITFHLQASDEVGLEVDAVHISAVFHDCIARSFDIRVASAFRHCTDYMITLVAIH